MSVNKGGYNYLQEAGGWVVLFITFYICFVGMRVVLFIIFYIYYILQGGE